MGLPVYFMYNGEIVASMSNAGLAPSVGDRVYIGDSTVTAVGYVVTGRKFWLKQDAARVEVLLEKI